MIAECADKCAPVPAAFALFSGGLADLDEKSIDFRAFVGFGQGPAGLLDADLRHYEKGRQECFISL